MKTPQSCSSHRDPFANSKEKGRDSDFTFSVLATLVLCSVLGARESFVMVGKEGTPDTYDPEKAFEC